MDELESNSVKDTIQLSSNTSSCNVYKAYINTYVGNSVRINNCVLYACDIDGGDSSITDVFWKSKVKRSYSNIYTINDVRTITIYMCKSILQVHVFHADSPSFLLQDTHAHNTIDNDLHFFLSLTLLRQKGLRVLLCTVYTVCI
jgi:hypothetical protein